MCDCPEFAMMQEDGRKDRREDEDEKRMGNFSIRCLSIALLELALATTATATWNEY
jgi:hypothetical protein